MSPFLSGDLSEPVPVYVTRKSASGETGTFTLSIWMPLLALFLVWFNVVAWSVIGLVEAVRYFT